MKSFRFKIKPDKDVFENLDHDLFDWDKKINYLFEWVFALRAKSAQTKDLKTNAISNLSIEDLDQKSLRIARRCQKDNEKLSLSDPEVLSALHDFYLHLTNSNAMRSVQGLLFTGKHDPGQGRPAETEKYPKGHQYWENKSQKYNGKQSADELYESKLKSYEAIKNKTTDLMNAAIFLRDNGIIPLSGYSSTDKVDPADRVISKRAAALIQEYEAKNEIRIKEYNDLAEYVEDLRKEIPEDVVSSIDHLISVIRESQPTFNITRRYLRSWTKIRKKWLDSEITNNDVFYQQVFAEPSLWKEYDYISIYERLRKYEYKLANSKKEEILTLGRINWPAWEDDLRPKLIQHNGKIFLKIRHIFNSSKYEEIEIMSSKQTKGLAVINDGKLQKIQYNTNNGKKIFFLKSARLFKRGNAFYFDLSLEEEPREYNPKFRKINSYFNSAYSASIPKDVDLSEPFKVAVIDLGLRPLAAIAILKWQPKDLNGAFLDANNQGSFYCENVIHFRDQKPSFMSHFNRKMKHVRRGLACYKNIKNNKENDLLTEFGLDVIEPDNRLRVLNDNLGLKIQDLKTTYNKAKAKRILRKDKNGYKWLRLVRDFISLLRSWMDRHLVEKEKSKVILSKYWDYYNRLSRDLARKFAHNIVAIASKQDCSLMVFENLDGYSVSDEKTREENKLLSAWKHENLRDMIESKAKEIGIETSFSVDPAGTSSRHWKTGEIGNRDRRKSKLFSTQKPVNDQTNGALGIAYKWATKNHLHSLWFKLVEIDKQEFLVFENEERKRPTGIIQKFTGNKFLILQKDKNHYKVTNAGSLKQIKASAKESKKYVKLHVLNRHEMNWVKL